MYCIKCGAKNDDQAKYCYECGTPLRTDLVVDKAVTPSRQPKAIWPGLRRWSLEYRVVAIISLMVFVFILVLGGWAVILVISPGGTSEVRTLLTPQATRAVGDSELATRIESAQHFMTKDDFENLANIGSYFTNPRTREVITGEITIAALFTTPSDYDGKTVRITGQVLKKTLVLDVLPDGWPTSYYLIIDDETDSLPVLYRGNAKAIEVGDTVRVTGLFSKAGNGINADTVQKFDLLTNFIRQPIRLVLAYLITTVLVLTFMIFSIRFFWRIRWQAKTKAAEVAQM